MNSIDIEKEYVLKKFGMTNDEFDKILKEAPRPHSDFDTDQRLWDKYFKVIKMLKFGR